MTADGSQSGLAALFRCRPVCWEILSLRDRSESFLVPIPAVKCFHPFINGVRLALIVGVSGDFRIAPTASLILLFANQLAIVLMDRFPSEDLFCGCFG